MKKSQLAINSVSTKNAKLEDFLPAYAAAGFAQVEFNLGHVKDYLKQGHVAADVRRLLDQHRLRCIGGYETTLQSFSAPEARAVNHDLIVANARLLGELGATTMVVGTDGPADPKQVADVVGEIAKEFARVAARIADTGVTICVEFNWGPVVKSLRTAAEVARRSQAKNVGVLFDPAHYHCTPSKFDQINAANVPFIKHVHVDDMRDKPGELSNANNDRMLPGQGHLDLRAIFGALEQHGYRGFFSIEMFDKDLWALPPLEAARKMYQSLLTLCD